MQGDVCLPSGPSSMQLQEGQLPACKLALLTLGVVCAAAVGAVTDPSTTEQQEKSVYVVFFAGERARAKIMKVLSQALQDCQGVGTAVVTCTYLITVHVAAAAAAAAAADDIWHRQSFSQAQCLSACCAGAHMATSCSAAALLVL